MPPWAYSNLPIRSAEASVNAPFTWPNSSLSRMFSLNAAQFSATNGLFFRGLFWWIAWATSSLPVPVSPWISTLALVGRDPLEPLDHVAHQRAVADDALEAEPLVEPALQLEVGPLQPRALDRLLGAGAKLGDVQRLEQIVERPAAAWHRPPRAPCRGRSSGSPRRRAGRPWSAARMPSPSMSFITRSVITASKGDSSISRAPSLPEVATRQWKPVRSRLSATVSACGLIVVDDQDLGGRVEDVVGNVRFRCGHARDDNESPGNRPGDARVVGWLTNGWCGVKSELIWRSIRPPIWRSRWTFPAVHSTNWRSTLLWACQKYGCMTVRRWRFTNFSRTAAMPARPAARPFRSCRSRKSSAFLPVATRPTRPRGPARFGSSPSNWPTGSSRLDSAAYPATIRIMDRGQGISRRAFLCRTGALGVAGVVAGCPTAGAREAGASPFARRLPVPPFPPNLEWVNAGPVDLGRLRGHFILLDFWTLGCINCMHLIPELKKLEKAWPDELVVIGVHSAKFESERDIKNIQAAALRYGIAHPIVNDARFTIWNSFGIQAWPSLVLIDPEGYAVWGHSGEITFAELDGLLRRAVPYYRRKGSLAGESVRLARKPVAEDAKSALRFPGKILADESGGRLIISDSGHNRILLAGLDGSLRETIGSGASGRADGSFATAQFNAPAGIGAGRQRPLCGRHLEPPGASSRSGRQARDHDRRHRRAEPPPGVRTFRQADGDRLEQPLGPLGARRQPLYRHGRTAPDLGPAGLPAQASASMPATETKTSPTGRSRRGGSSSRVAPPLRSRAGWPATGIGSSSPTAREAPSAPSRWTGARR